MSSIVGLAILVLDVWAIVNVWRSRDGTGKKVLWTVIVVVLPVLGLVAWWFAGPRK